MAGSSNVSEAQIQISIVRWLQDVMVKSRAGRLSEPQKACHSELSACGVHVYTVRAIGDCRAVLTGLVTLRQPTPHGRLIEELSKQMGGY